MYDAARYYPMYTLEGCKDKCAQFSNVLMVGFDYSYFWNDCWCYFNSGFLAGEDKIDCPNEEAFECWSWDFGSGPVVSVSEEADRVCYKNDNFSETYSDIPSTSFIPLSLSPTVSSVPAVKVSLVC